MIRDNQRTLNQLHIVIDGVLIALAYVAAWYLKFVLTPPEEPGMIYGVLSKETYFSFLYYIIPGYLIIYYSSGLYNSIRYSGIRKEIFNVFRANSIGLAAIFACIYIFKVSDVSRIMMGYFYFISVVWNQRGVFP